MSQAVQGVITDIKTYPLNAPDQYGKTHRVKATIGGIIYDMGKIKAGPAGQLELRIQAGKDWVTLLPGDTVQFFAKSKDVNGKTYYDKEGKVMLVAKGNGVPPAGSPAQAAAPTPRAPAVTPGGDALQIRIENGQAFNIACDVLIASGQDITSANLLPLLAAIHAARDQVAAAGWGRRPLVVPTPAAAPVAATPAPVSAGPTAASGTPATSTATADEFDEADIPF